MKKVFWMATLVSVAMLLVSTPVLAGYAYKTNKPHLGGDVTPVEAFEMLQNNPEHTFLVDCRTRAEYQYVGHPEGAYNIPIRFLSTEAGTKGYREKDNPNFGQDLLARFNPATDTLIIFCRSGNRSCAGCNEAIKAGWPEDKVFNMMGGFEGGKNKNKASQFYGQRWDGGWRLEGLPWTYSMDTALMYKPDVDKTADSRTAPRLKVAYK
jgi:rhodanese-related sulfurtransferase